MAQKKFIRVVATTPEKTHNQKFLTFETIFNRFFVQFYPGLKKKKKKKKKSCHPYLGAGKHPSPLGKKKKKKKKKKKLKKN